MSKKVTINFKDVPSVTVTGVEDVEVGPTLIKISDEYSGYFSLIPLASINYMDVEEMSA